jgi:hypothetical protein
MRLVKDQILTLNRLIKLDNNDIILSGDNNSGKKNIIIHYLRRKNRFYSKISVLLMTNHKIKWKKQIELYKINFEILFYQRESYYNINYLIIDLNDYIKIDFSRIIYDKIIIILKNIDLINFNSSLKNRIKITNNIVYHKLNLNNLDIKYVNFYPINNHYNYYFDKVLDDCPVCFEKKIVLKLNCNHLICNECLSKWKSSCPCCRQDLKIPNYYINNKEIESYFNNEKSILIENEEINYKLFEKKDYIFINKTLNYKFINSIFNYIYFKKNKLIYLINYI